MKKKDLLKLINETYGDDLLQLEKELSAYKNIKSTAALKSTKSKRKITGETVVSLDNVQKTYSMGRKNKVNAVKSVSLDVVQGEIVALVGPSGSGKSTLLNLIGGLDKPTSGDVVVAGQNLQDLSDRKLSEYRASTVGFVFQFFYLQPFLNLQTNVEIPMMFARSNRKDRHETSEQYIQAVGLGDRVHHKPKELSGGQIQRTAIARSLVNKPRVILADEPTGNLDSKNGQAVMDLLEKVRDQYNTAVIVVTHDEKTAARADRVIELEDGEIV